MFHSDFYQHSPNLGQICLIKNKLDLRSSSVSVIVNIAIVAVVDVATAAAVAVTIEGVVGTAKVVGL